jgi:hypothetical protein
MPVFVTWIIGKKEVLARRRMTGFFFSSMST